MSWRSFNKKTWISCLKLTLNHAGPYIWIYGLSGTIMLIQSRQDVCGGIPLTLNLKLQSKNDFAKRKFKSWKIGRFD